MSTPLKRRQGRPHALKRETVEALRVWAAVGRSVPEVARNLGVSPGTVWRYLHSKHKREIA